MRSADYSQQVGMTVGQALDASGVCLRTAALHLDIDNTALTRRLTGEVSITMRELALIAHLVGRKPSALLPAD